MDFDWDKDGHLLGETHNGLITVRVGDLYVGPETIKVAIKRCRIPKGNCHHHESNRGALNRERDNNAKVQVLAHPNLPVFYGTAITDEPGLDILQADFVMEILQGDSTALFSGGRGLHGSRLLKFLLGVARGLAALHSLENGISTDGNPRKFVHTDLKPKNIMIRCRTARVEGQEILSSHVHSETCDLDPVIIDFGGSLGLGRTTSKKPARDSGTERFKSPEQIKFQRLRPSSDIFSFGLLALTAATGREPWSWLVGKDQVERAVLDGVPPQRMDDMPSSGPFRDLVDRCLSLDPERRATAQACVVMIEELLTAVQD
jgi:serine/threonine protein kinase